MARVVQGGANTWPSLTHSVSPGLRPVGVRCYALLLGAFSMGCAMEAFDASTPGGTGGHSGQSEGPASESDGGGGSAAAQGSAGAAGQAAGAGVLDAPIWTDDDVAFEVVSPPAVFFLADESTPGWSYATSDPTAQMIEYLGYLRLVPNPGTWCIDGAHEQTLTILDTDGASRSYIGGVPSCTRELVVEHSWWAAFVATLPPCREAAALLQQATNSELAPTLEANGCTAVVSITDPMFFAVEVPEGASRRVAFDNCIPLPVEVTDAGGQTVQTVTGTAVDCPELDLAEPGRFLVSLLPTDSVGGAWMEVRVEATDAE
jgi:hypothetical protein